VSLLMRKPPRSGFFYSEAVEDIIHLPDLTVWDRPRMQPIGFTAQHVEPKPARRVTKKKPAKRARALGHKRQ
jgi:hypothetical protein